MKEALYTENSPSSSRESEHSAATTCEGFAVAGGRVTNFTSRPVSPFNETARQVQSILRLAF
jgi:hypothetical protein